MGKHKVIDLSKRPPEDFLGEEQERRDYNSSLLEKAKKKGDLYRGFDFYVYMAPKTISTKCTKNIREDMGLRRSKIETIVQNTQIPVKSGELPIRTLEIHGDPSIERGDKIEAWVFLGKKEYLKRDSHIWGSWSYSQETQERFKSDPCVETKLHLKKPTEYFVYVPREPTDEEVVVMIHKLSKDGGIVRTWEELPTD